MRSTTEVIFAWHVIAASELHQIEETLHKTVLVVFTSYQPKAPDAAELGRLHEATRGAMRDIDRVATAALRHAAGGKHRLVERDVLARVLDLDERDA